MYVNHNDKLVQYMVKLLSLPIVYFLLPFALILNGATESMAQNTNSGYSGVCNAHGYVLEAEPSYKLENTKGKLLRSKLYLGKSCDAYSENLGDGAWCWTNAGVLTEFGGESFPLTGLELPMCPQHSNTSSCGCWEAPLPQMQALEGSQDNANEHDQEPNEQAEERVQAMAVPTPNGAPKSAGTRPKSSNSEGALQRPTDTRADKPAGAEADHRKSGVRRSEKNGFIYYQIDNCEFERGLATTVYNYLDRPAKVEMTDLCFDRDDGSLLAAEPINNLTLVENQGTMDRFEVLKPNTKYYERTGVSASKYGTQLPENERFGYSGTFADSNRGTYAATRHDAHSFWTRGFLYSETTPYSGVKFGQYNITLAVNDSWEQINRSGGLKRSGETPIIIVHGTSNILDHANEIKIEAKTDFVVGDIKINMNMNNDGVIEGSGSISVKNPRLSGTNPHDWNISELNISNITGFFVGDHGREFRAIGFITGNTADHDGFVHESFGSINILGHFVQNTSADEAAQKQIGQPTINEPGANLHIEEQLKQLGFDPGPVDGIFDDTTRAAINAFQKQYGLPQVNVLPPEQVAVLEAMVKARSN